MTEEIKKRDSLNIYPLNIMMNEITKEPKTGTGNTNNNNISKLDINSYTKYVDEISIIDTKNKNILNTWGEAEK